MMEDREPKISNSHVERGIKIFAIDKKTFVFTNTPSATQGSTIICNLMETAKENELDPYNVQKLLP